MSNLIDDGSLVGLWPLHESSGAPSWKNYSPAYAGHPSGLSFDFLVHTADAGSAPDDDSAASPWPGLDTIDQTLSGVVIKGLKLQGTNQRVTSSASAPFSKMLVLGNGTRSQRVATLGPVVANSGFTAGFWVYPMTDGWINASTEGGFSLASDSWFTGYGRTHSLMGQFQNDIGWYMGVSGSLDYATPVSDSKFGPHQLRAFLLADQSAGVPPELDTPIESGRYTHLTMSYRYVDGTSNEIVLYKDGRLAASGVTNTEIAFDSNNALGPDASVLNLGGSTDGTWGTDSFELTSGWGHLVSGAYCFRRVLHEGEILEMHQRGGLQPDLSLRNNVTSVAINDDHLVAYVEGKAPGWVDASKNHYSFIAPKDPGDRAGSFVWDPGPFNVNRAHQDVPSNGFDFIVVPSGACLELANAPGGFTICGFFQPIGSTNDRDGSMMISWGSVSTATSGPATPASVSESTLGMMLTYFLETGFGDRIALEVFPVGDGTDGNRELRPSGSRIWRSTNVHYGIVYDAATQGLALYVDGYEAVSGTLPHSLQPHLINLVGSGYPLMFTNGISNQTVNNATTKGVLGNGGIDMTSGPFALFSRPLLADEMRFMAHDGIDTSSLWRTRYDPRLMGYWSCNTFDLGDVIVDDLARAMSPVTGPLARGDTTTKWERIFNINNTQSDQDVFRNDGTAFIDLFTGETRTPDAYQQTFGNLGITSGIFCPQGGSHFAGQLSNNADSRNTPFNADVRYQPATEERDGGPQSLNEYIISFEVTPSGNILPLEATSQATTVTQRWFNSQLYVHGNLANGAADGETAAFLTTVNEGLGSGVTICFVARDGASSSAITPIMSGNLPFGVPSRVLLHAKFDEPYRVNDFLVGNSPLTISLWVDGQKVNQRTDGCTNWRMWSDQIPDSTNADWFLQFGGSAATNLAISSITVDGGLGEIYMREIFIMRGIFEKDEVRALAASGIQSPTIAGYTAQLPTTQVTIVDSALEGYWRFNGFDGNVGQVSNSPGGSGTTDLSFKGNHLDAIAQRFYEEGTSVDLAETQRALPGPLKNSDLGIQCSGFHNQSIVPASTGPNMLPPFAVSGVGFDTPADGFSVGFLMAKRQGVGNNSFDALMCYGVLTGSPAGGTVSDTSLDPNRGWVIGMDDAENMKMIVSIGGTMHLDATAVASNSGQVICGMTNLSSPLIDLRGWEKSKQGEYRIPSLDYWDHYCWTYDPSIAGGSGISCYLNGNLVDRQFVPQTVGPQAADGTRSPLLSPWTGAVVAPQTPVEPTTRMITFKSHQTAGQSPAAWDFRQNLLIDTHSVFTDVFYFSRALSEPEVRYVAQNGIDSAVGVPASGIIGGFIHGQDTGSGIIGGFSFGQDTGSGIIGGFMPGGLEGSGLFGGYVSGVVFSDGTIGGWIRGQDDMSGIMAGFIQGVDIGSGSVAGYIAGQDVGSGLFGGLMFGALAPSGLFGGFINSADIGSGLLGGYILGGLQGNFEFDAGFTISVIAAEDFDAQLEIAKTVSSDFDAKVIIFQDEVPPLVDIIVPDASVSGLMPPFNQYFVAKASGQQGKTIASTKWTFGDFTPSVTVAESGAGCYPIQHMYASSGFFIAKFEAIDSDGLHASATRIINAASGIDPVLVGLSGVPRAGNAELIVDFTTTIDILPPGVSIITQLLNYDDGQTTIAFSPTHSYTQPGTYKPIWCVRDSRGIIWCDSLEAGNDFLESGGA